MSNYEQIKNNPTAYFKNPQDVLNNKNLTKQQQIAILRSWEFDVREQEVAEEENMPNTTNTNPDILADILTALRALGAGVDVLHTPPTKQGGE